MVEQEDIGTFGCFLGVFICFVIGITGIYWFDKINMVLRILTLFGVPLFVFYLTTWLLDKFEVTNKTMILLKAILAVTIGIFLIIIAILASQQAHHWETILVNKGDQTFEEEVIKGADRGNAFLCLLFAIPSIIYGLDSIKKWYKYKDE